MAARDSGQRTEKPTAKRLKEARRGGQIPRSADLVGWFTLLVATFVAPVFMGALRREMENYLHTAQQAIVAGEPAVAMGQAQGVLVSVAVLFLPVLFFLMVVTTAGMAVQGGVTLTAKPLRPKLERISPKAGLKRMISAQSVVETAKAVLRLIILAILVTQMTVSFISSYLGGTSQALGPTGIEIGASLLLLIQLAAVLGLVVGLADYAFQRHKIAKQLRMTKYEVKQESRNTEGNPLVRDRRRSMHAKISRNQMLTAVSEASVVVVNPTHVAVALSYEAGGVPSVVAKGGDELARRIKERAFEAGVPVVETRPLARVLHDLLEVGDEVPAHLYEAVAIVIAFVMRRPQLPLDRVVRRLTLPPSKLSPPPTA
ncbi:MAG: EscU/YscU/HrcU family type III secretion system export apparatus switch protein [Actinomycetia bacterium]|nr:EscU/YscU/HrcU family type III secretion system export apparatus switch protein [Actinomycetes bacterium]MCP4223866.1 EscU/YscU/HrcU family type III secretion system export apparatus switch protein [Actinomycetes bacterium]MCP5035308.1 EscU/YscU/HrcU family type III secretion system export apparatus switch protein [Actinomycetes bacterium]